MNTSPTRISIGTWSFVVAYVLCLEISLFGFYFNFFPITVWISTTIWIIAVANTFPRITSTRVCSWFRSTSAPMFRIIATAMTVTVVLIAATNMCVRKVAVHWSFLTADGGVNKNAELFRLTAILVAIPWVA